MISSLLHCRVGLFYITEDWAKEKLEFLASKIPEEDIESRTKLEIRLKNGNCIKAVNAGTSARGSKFNRVLCQEGISEEVLNTVIKPTILLPIVTWR